MWGCYILFMTWLKFDTLFMTVAAGSVTLNISLIWKAFGDGLFDNYEKVASPRNTSNISNLEY